jgi:thiamine biosynthesis protein ThiI
VIQKLESKHMTSEQKFDTLILARIGEITLKGKNRKHFEKQLTRNMARRLKQVGHYEINQSQSRIWVLPQDEEAEQNLNRAMKVVTSVFGVVSASPVRRFESGMDELFAQACDYVRHEIIPRPGMTFKVETRRGDKQFPLISQEISARTGEAVLSCFDELSVDVHQPDFTLYCEVRDQQMYLYSKIVPGVRGLPTGTSGKAMLLLSGGIDSPVAGYLIASRGVTIESIYFHTFPYTSDRAKEKVVELATRVADYSGKMRLHVVDFTETQLAINAACPAEHLTVVTRRMMMRVSERLARKTYCQALITGESLGQVASQTLEALNCTNAVTTMPVFRPLIGLDKDDTIEIARRIDTFDTSILPYEDCCTVFVAKSPRTRPTIEQVEKAEEKLDVDQLTQDCLNKIETINISWD